MVWIFGQDCCLKLKKRFIDQAMNKEVSCNLLSYKSPDQGGTIFMALFLAINIKSEATEIWAEEKYIKFQHFNYVPIYVPIYIYCLGF